MDGFSHALSGESLNNLFHVESLYSIFSKEPDLNFERSGKNS